MKKLALVVLFFILTISKVSAKDFVAGSVVALHSHDNTVFTGDVVWSKGRCGGFGFVDVLRHGKLEYIANTNVDCKVSERFFTSVEVGKSNFGYTTKAGFGVSAPVPGMRFAKISFYPAVSKDGGDSEQVKLTYLTKDLRISDGYSLYSSAFIRLRKDISDLSQIQLWAKGGSRFHFGIEIQVLGGAVDTFLAGKYTF